MPLARRAQRTYSWLAPIQPRPPTSRYSVFPGSDRPDRRSIAVPTQALRLADMPHSTAIRESMLRAVFQVTCRVSLRFTLDLSRSPLRSSVTTFRIRFLHFSRLHHLSHRHY